MGSTFRSHVLTDLKKLEYTYYLSIKKGAILMCIDGRFVALEIKKEDITPLQRHTIKKVIEANGIAFIVYPDNWFEIYAYLEMLTKEKK